MHRRVLFFLCLLALPLAVFAKGGHASHAAHSGTVHVHGYFRHDGTYVQSYDRAAPGTGTGTKASTSSKQTNLDTCLSGKRAPGCNYSLLAPEELTQVQAAERRVNLEGCVANALTGCNRALLTPGELAQVVSIGGQTGAATSATPSISLRPSLAPSGSVPHATGSGYINVDGQWVPSPAWTKDGKPPAGAVAKCRDGSFSFSRHQRGTCAYHGGVARWL